MIEDNWKDYHIDLSRELQKATFNNLIKLYPHIVEFNEGHELTKALEASKRVTPIKGTWQITYKEYATSHKTIEKMVEEGIESLSRYFTKQISELIAASIDNDKLYDKICICYSVPLVAYESSKEDTLKLSITGETEVGIEWYI